MSIINHFTFTVPCKLDAKIAEDYLDSFIECQCHVTVECWESKIIGDNLEIMIQPWESFDCKDNKDFADAFADYLPEEHAMPVPANSPLSLHVMHQLCQLHNAELAEWNATIRLGYNASGLYAHKMGAICTHFYGVTYSYGEAQISAYIRGYIDGFNA